MNNGGQFKQQQRANQLLLKIINYKKATAELYRGPKRNAATLPENVLGGMLRRSTFENFRKSQGI